MKKMKRLFVFAALLTMLAYTGCGGVSETLTEVNSAAPAVAENGISPDAIPEAEPKSAEAPAAEEAFARDDVMYDIAVADDDFGGYGEDADFAGDAVDMDSVREGAEAALSVIKSAESPAMGAEGEYNGFDIADVAGEIAYDDDYDDSDAEIIIEPEPGEEPQTEPAVGLLTAGEWKDHDNWGFFSNLVNTGIIEFPSFGIEPTQRIAVTVTDNDGNPLPNAEITLSDDSQSVYRARTDKNGRAYVFEMNGQTGTKITASQNDISQTIEIESALTDEQGNVQTGDRAYEIKLDTEQKLYSDTQIMFIVDTTGSMGDEMLFLQSDFSAITDEAGDEHTTYALNFYKDEGDVYVTNYSGFTSDTQEIKNRLNEEFASGGGDDPEAVYEALKESIYASDWADESVKIAFLIYDAPPHSETDFQPIIEEASARGIHMIPVVSSNGSRETELFGRALAICTNGDYVFLTDDSGIGGSHLEPIIGDYEVESLHDIIVRIINDYKQ